MKGTITLYRSPDSGIGDGFRHKEVHFEVQVKTLECPEGWIITAEGGCSFCEGPELFSINYEPKLFYRNLESCSRCEDEAMQCDGGSGLLAQEGYQRVIFDIFVPCPSIHGHERCLFNNTCEVGYQGFRCS
mmetsp:Transcript_13363/g.20876  ORF Transcript_13363/g.20876 Transcript_13363/m.20876 type:complete len:131 (-) Transcript_13363:4131-4523(-)